VFLVPLASCFYRVLSNIMGEFAPPLMQDDWNRVDCPECGFGYIAGLPSNETAHEAFHQEHVNGPSVDLEEGTYFIDARTDRNIREVVAVAARLSNRDTNYDFPLYDGSDDEDEYVTLVVIKVSERRIVGLIVTRVRDCEYTAELESFAPDVTGGWRPTNAERIPRHSRRALDMIWVLKKYRGKGILRGMLLDLSAHINEPVSELSHSLPFTEDAVSFWKKLNLTKIRVC
jgi:hypothetical protein